MQSSAFQSSTSMAPKLPTLHLRQRPTRFRRRDNTPYTPIPLPPSSPPVPPSRADSRVLPRGKNLPWRSPDLFRNQATPGARTLLTCPYPLTQRHVTFPRVPPRRANTAHRRAITRSEYCRLCSMLCGHYLPLPHACWHNTCHAPCPTAYNCLYFRGQRHSYSHGYDSCPGIWWHGQEYSGWEEVPE